MYFDSTYNPVNPFLRFSLLPWFDALGDLGVPIRVPGWSKFQTLDSQSNIVLTGVPDEILRHPERGTWIGDYKTARFTETQNALTPLYVVQLNAYAFIAAKIGLGPVAGMGLIFYEPVTDLPPSTLDCLIKRCSFLMEFSRKIQPVKVEPALIPPLLRRVREIYDQETCPSATKDCKDCERLNLLLQLVNETPASHIGAAPEGRADFVFGQC